MKVLSGGKERLGRDVNCADGKYLALSSANTVLGGSNCELHFIPRLEKSPETHDKGTCTCDTHHNVSKRDGLRNDVRDYQP